MEPGARGRVDPDAQPTKGTTMKAALTIAGLALAFTGVTGCGSDDAPADASEEDFCANFTEFDETLQSFGDDPDVGAVVKAMKGAADDMEETGTPEDMPDDARAGFEFTIDKLQGLDDDASEEDVAALGEDISESDEKDSAAFDEYLSDTCGVG
jgi:hypothetical protein